MMPGIDGFETCRRLKAGPAAHVPVIFMTALSETEHIVAGLGAGGRRLRHQAHPPRRASGPHPRPSRQCPRGAERPGGARHVGRFAPGARPRRRDPLVDPAGAAALLRAALPERRRAAGRGRAAAPRRPQPAPDPVVQTGPTAGWRSASPISGPRAPASCCSASARHDRRPDEDACCRSASRLTAREAEVLLWIARGKTQPRHRRDPGSQPRAP